MAEHINTFDKGMTSDVNIVLQPDGTYRYMKNCSLISQDGNNYVIKDCLGNIKTFSINIPYDTVYTVVGTPPMPIGFISFPDKLIVFSTNNESTGGYGEIGVINYVPYGEGIQPLAVAGQYNSGYVPLYHHASLNYSKLHHIEGFGFIENELIERIYWTDNFNEPRVFNVSDPIFSNYILSGSLVAGEQYMVLEGAVLHNGNNYGPGMVNTNIFTAGGGTPTIWASLTGTSPTPKVIKYYPYQLLDWTPSRTLGNIIFDEYGTGSLFCGNKVYFYRLGRSGVPSTSWSYGSSPVPVGKLNTYITSPSVPYHDFVGAGTISTPVKSGLSVFVTISNIDPVYTFIELACAEFDQLIGVPRLISIVNRVDITASTMSIEHTGDINLGNLTIGDITLFPASILKVKTLTTNKNFNLIANITERQELDISFPNVNATPLKYYMNSHRDADSCSLSGMVYSGVSPVSGARPGPTTITPWSRWLVTFGDNGANTVTYNGTQYITGQVIVGVTGAGNDTITYGSGLSQVRPCVTRNKYTVFSSGARVENAIEIKGTNPANDCFWDYKSAAAHHHVAGYWGDETYRFGILFYDLKGNPFYVRHLIDFHVPTDQGNFGIIRSDVIGNTGDLVYSLAPSMVNFTGIEIPASVINKISGFSIVRAERDAKVITQGLVTQCVHTGATPDVYRPGAWIPVQRDLNDTVTALYTFISPDLLVGVPLKNTAGVVGDTMERACWVDAYDFGGGVRVRGGTANPAGSEQVYSKIITNLTGDGTNRTGVITYWNEVAENGTLSDFGAGATLTNTLSTAAANVNVNGACVTGTANYNLNSHQGVGSKKVIFKLDADFLHYSSVNGYTSTAAVAQTEKILMNYTKTGFSNPYGGMGDQALANTIYISTGHYQPITTAVKTAVFDGVNYTFTNVEVGGGDCFTCLIDQGYGLWKDGFANKFSYAWTFPCECNANYNLRRGRKTSNVEMYYTGTALTESIVFLDPSANIHFEDYSYNQGYSAEQLTVYPALPVNFINSSQFKARTRFAGPKFIGEVIDSFRTFALLDFKDLSANYGRINKIDVKDDKVIVWQDNAISTVPILERQLLSSTTGDATTIGTGGVVDRFDVISSYFGTQHQWSVIPTEFGFVFFDMRRKAVVVLSFSGGLIEVSHIHGLKGYFDEAFIEITGSNVIDTAQLLNSPTFAETSDRPLVGVGITGVYDPKFKMTYLTFKFKGQKKITISAASVDAYQSKDFTIGLLHNNLQHFFVGFFDWFPAIAHNHNQVVLSANNPKNTTQFLAASGTNTGLSFVAGDTYPVGSDEYVCVLAVTLDNVAKYPTGASGSTYWTKINTTNELWVHNQPALLAQLTAPDYQYDKFFGRVVDNEVQIVVNPKSPNAFSVLNIEQEGNNVNFTDIYTSSSYQSASDLSIKSWSKFYRVIYDKICSSLPLSTTGRLTDSYVLIRFVKKNWDTLPTTLTGSVKIFRWLKSYYEQKR